MRNVSFTLPWGKVYTLDTRPSQAFPIFRGSPEKYAQALLARYGNWAAALGFLVGTKLDLRDPFFLQVNNYIVNRIEGKSRAKRAEELAAKQAQAPAPHPTVQ